MRDMKREARPSVEQKLAVLRNRNDEALHCLTKLRQEAVRQTSAAWEYIYRLPVDCFTNSVKESARNAARITQPSKPSSTPSSA